MSDFYVCLNGWELFVIAILFLLFGIIGIVSMLGWMNSSDKLDKVRCQLFKEHLKYRKVCDDLYRKRFNPDVEIGGEKDEKIQKGNP